MKYLADYLNIISFLSNHVSKKKPDTKMPGFFFVKTPDINQFDKPLMSS
jgi:hypothetical protein